MTQPDAVCRQECEPIINPATGWPWQSPPWGELMAVNVNTAEIAWRIPFGRVRRSSSLWQK
jgi:glucose dehydrogenase